MGALNQDTHFWVEMKKIKRNVNIEILPNSDEAFVVLKEINNSVH